MLINDLGLPVVQNSGAVWKLRWPSWAPGRNKPTVSVDVKQYFNFSQLSKKLQLIRTSPEQVLPEKPENWRSCWSHRREHSNRREDWWIQSKATEEKTGGFRAKHSEWVVEHTHWRCERSPAVNWGKLRDPNIKRFKWKLIYFDTNTRYAIFWGNPLCQATKQHLNNR